LEEYGNEAMLDGYRQLLAIRDSAQDTALYQRFRYGSYLLGFVGIQKKIVNFVVNCLIHHIGNSVDDAQIYLRGDPNTNGSTDPSHSQLAKDHDDHPFHTLAGMLAMEAVRTVGREMLRSWQGSSAANPGLMAAQFLVHPFDCHWQDRIVANWAKAHPDQIKRAESATAMQTLQEGYLKDALSTIKKLGNDSQKRWDYIYKYFEAIFDDKNQVKSWEKYSSR
jgi:hypothetical protein